MSFEHSDEGAEDMVKLQLQRVSGRCKRLRQRAARRRVVLLKGEMMQAWRGRRFVDFYRVRAMLAGTGRAPRKRLLWWPSQQADRHEWQELLAKPGQEGGLLADEIPYADCEKQVVAERDAEEDEAILVQAATIRQVDDDERGMCWELRRMAKRKAWPVWTFPIAALHMSMMPWRRAERARHAGLGADAKQTQGCPIFQGFMRKFLLRVRSIGWTPLAWHRSLAVALDKRGEKTGPRGMRLIHLFDAGGVAWFRALAARAPAVVPRPWSHGAVRGRSREAAILSQLSVSWRLRQMGVSQVKLLFDATNAFLLREAGGRRA